MDVFDADQLDADEPDREMQFTVRRDYARNPSRTILSLSSSCSSTVWMSRKPSSSPSNKSNPCSSRSEKALELTVLHLQCLSIPKIDNLDLFTRCTRLNLTKVLAARPEQNKKARKPRHPHKPREALHPAQPDKNHREHQPPQKALALGHQLQPHRSSRRSRAAEKHLEPEPRRQPLDRRTSA